MALVSICISTMSVLKQYTKKFSTTFHHTQCEKTIEENYENMIEFSTTGCKMLLLRNYIGYLVQALCATGEQALHSGTGCYYEPVLTYL
jgi:hypothetical protein